MLRPTRRDLLKSGALMGAGLATGMTPAALMKALASATCSHMSDIEHIVILIQENRSFDHYFGRYKGVRGFGDHKPNNLGVFAQSYPFGAEPLTVPNPLLPFHIDTAITLPPHAGECTNDIDHQWAGQHNTWNNGALDKWMTSHITTNGPAQGLLTMGYYQGSPARDHSGDLDLYWALADNFTICDNYYCSAIGGTDVNRLLSMTGTIDPDGWDGGLQFVDTQTQRLTYAGKFGTLGKWKPYPEVLSQNGVSWKVYSTPDGTYGDNVLLYFKDFVNPASPLFLQAFGNEAFPVDFLTQFATDCLLDQLPKVSWLLADLADTEHAPAPIEWGQDVVHTILSTLVETGQWKKTALLITWDENGGFFDHVPPPVPPAATPGEFLAHNTATGDNAGILGPVGLGFRVPLLVVSPFSRNPNPTGAPMVCSDPVDHTSLLRFIETRFGVPIPMRDPVTQTPGLSPWRRAAVGDLTSAFNFAGGALTSEPHLPATNRVDLRVLAECVTTGELGSLDSTTAPIAQGYPVPPIASMPAQETFIGKVKRPSGIC